MRGALRQAVEHEVLVADQAAGTFRFRHPLLAEAVYSTILPGEREELHARLAGELSRTAAASPAELAPHWAAAGRAAEALAASVEAARQAEAVFGLAEAAAPSRAGARAVAGCPRRGRLDRSRPGRALLLGGRTRQPDRRLAPCGRTRPARHRAHRGPGPGRCRPAARAPRGVPVRERQQRRRAGRVRARGRARPAAVGGAGAGARGVRHRVAHGLAAPGVTRGLRAGARARAGDRGASGRASGAHRARQRPRLPRPRRGGPGPARPGRAARRGNRRSDGPAAGVHHPHRRADHARPARGVGAGGC